MINFFATNFKFLREKNKMTQTDISKKLGKDYSTIGKWENGQRYPIMLDVIRIAQLFNVSLEDLILKDLRIEENQTNEKKQFSEEEKKEDLKQVLKDKGFLNENEEISKDDVNKLIDFAKRNKDYIIDKKEER